MYHTTRAHTCHTTRRLSYPAYKNPVSSTGMEANTRTINETGTAYMRATHSRMYNHTVPMVQHYLRTFVRHQWCTLTSYAHAYNSTGFCTFSSTGFFHFFPDTKTIHTLGFTLFPRLVFSLFPDTNIHILQMDKYNDENKIHIGFGKRVQYARKVSGLQVCARLRGLMFQEFER